MALGFGLFALSQWATSKSDQANAAPELDWYHDEASAYAAATRTGKPIFVDMWAEWCEACKKMDVTTLADPKVVAALRERWILLKLDFTETSAASDDLQQKYSVQSLPTFVLLPKTADLSQKYAITGYVNETTLMGELLKFIKH
jgi:thiol:disulfide interchange protein DsbD